MKTTKKNKDQSKKIKNKGVTLIELLIVISIITVLTGMVTAGSIPFAERARRTKANAQIAQIETALEAYRSDFLKYPTDGNPAGYEDDNAYILEQLSGKSRTDGSAVAAIINDSRWNGPYFDPKEEDIALSGGARMWVDPWKRPFHIRLAADSAVGDGNPPFNHPLTFDL